MLTQKQIHIITVFPLFFSEITPRANNAVRTDTKIFIFNLQILIFLPTIPYIVLFRSSKYLKQE